MRRRGEAWRRSDDAFEGERGLLGLVDPRRVVRQPQRDQLRAQLGEVAPARALVRELAERGDRDRFANPRATEDRLAAAVEREPGTLLAMLERAEVETRAPASGSAGSTPDSRSPSAA